ncbi:MAG TPA: type II toxin-antitoxin system VapC family toxin [Vicinamibacterales bacterium]|nr:type II toxin-antitoxin system VapC family toxin [Vicinamibacterales bacterium]
MPPADPLQMVVLDASVAVRWVVKEEGSDEAAALLERDITWITPRLLLTEAASALRRKVADRALAPAAAGQSLDALLQAVADGVIRLIEDERVIAPALLLALSLQHKVLDCVYLALAEREGAGIATADDRLARLARSRGVNVLQVPHA